MAQATHEAHPDTPSRNTKKRAWCFTWNNYTNNNIEYLIQKLQSPTSYLFGEEVGDSGTPHLQGVVRFKNARSFSSVRKLFMENHIEPCKNWQASLNYCSKDGETYTNIEKQKTRTERMLEKYEGVRWKQWQQDVINIVESLPNDRTVNWFWEKGGNVGKSFLAKYLVLKYDAIIADGKKDNVFNQIKLWLDNHKDKEDPKLVLLDIPRYSLDYINYGVLEQVKNGLIYSGKYEGGICCFDSPHIIVFANEPPDRRKMSEDRWNIVEID